MVYLRCESEAVVSRVREVKFGGACVHAWPVSGAGEWPRGHVLNRLMPSAKLQAEKRATWQDATSHVE